MSRWLTAKTKDEFTGRVLWDLREKKITRDNPDFMEAIKAAIEYVGIEAAYTLINDVTVTKEDIDKALVELNKSIMEESNV